MQVSFAVRYSFNEPRLTCVFQAGEIQEALDLHPTVFDSWSKSCV